MYQPYPGGAELPELQRPPAPPSVLNAVKVRYVGAVTSLLGIVIDILTVSATKSAIAIVFLWRPSSTAFFKQAGTSA